MSEKWISIIVPCYNAEQYIERCINSIVRQTVGVEKLEIILIDDCSVDTTWEHIKKIENAYPASVIAVQCEENGRQGRARNIGLEYASAPYVAFVDADDWIEPDMYQKLYEKMQEYQCDIVLCDSWRDFADPQQTLPPKETGKENRLFVIDTVEKRKILLTCETLGVAVWNKLFRKDFLLEHSIIFPEKVAYEDHYFSSLLYFYVERLYIIEERLYHYFINHNSTTLSINGSHHFDILTVCIRLWEECETRGFLDDYRMELEYLFVALCYLRSMKMLILRWDAVPYEYFLRLKKETLLRIPDYHVNPYIHEYVTEANQVVLQLLDREISKEALNIFCKELKELVQAGMPVL